jgi:hypothetical protein
LRLASQSGYCEAAAKTGRTADRFRDQRRRTAAV